MFAQLTPLISCELRPETPLEDQLGIDFHSTNDEFSADDIDFIPTALLGQGAGGHVVKGRFKSTSLPVAIKIVSLDDKDQRKQLLNDLRTMKAIDNPFLIQQYLHYVSPGKPEVHIVLEFMDCGSLADVKARAKRIPQDMLPLFLVQILEGLKALHLNFVVHRDVKLANILVNSQGIVKVTDFGISKHLEGLAACVTYVGTTTHLSPERIEGREYSFPADIWAFGICAYELATGSYPYGNIGSFSAVFSRIVKQPEPRLPSDGEYSVQHCDFIVKCLQHLPELRASPIELVGHEYIQHGMFNVTQEQLMAWLHLLMHAPKFGS